MGWIWILFPFRPVALEELLAFCHSGIVLFGFVFLCRSLMGSIQVFQYGNYHLDDNLIG